MSYYYHHYHHPYYYQHNLTNPGTGGSPVPYSSYPAPTASWTRGWFAFSDSSYLKGLVLGAGVAYLLSNPAVQKALVKGAVTLWSTIQGGVEEVKEQIQDIKSEMSMKDDTEK